MKFLVLNTAKLCRASLASECDRHLGSRAHCRTDYSVMHGGAHSRVAVHASELKLVWCAVRTIEGLETREARRKTPEALTDECQVVQLEPKTTLNTGNLVNERTLRELESLSSSK